MELEVSCVTQRGRHFSPHLRIEALGGPGWRKRADEVVREIDGGLNSYFVARGDVRVRVVVASHLRRRYLRAEGDDYSPDTLLALPECPPEGTRKAG